MSGLMVREREVPVLLRALGLPVRAAQAQDGSEYADAWRIPCPTCRKGAADLGMTEDGELTVFCPRCGPGWRRYGVAEFVSRHVGQGSAPPETAAAEEAQSMSAAEVMASTQAVSWLADGLLPAGGLAVLGGDAGQGKSWVALSLCQAVADGRPWLGHVATSGPALCLYVDAEMGLPLVRERLNLLEFGGDTAERVRFLFDPPWRLGTEAVRALRREFQEAKPALVVLDCLGMLLPEGCDENANAGMLAVLRPLRDLAREQGCTVLVVHHYRKAQAFGSNTPEARLRGASAIMSIADAVLAVNPTRDEAERALLHAKARFGRKAAPFAVRFVETETGGLALVYGGEPSAKTVSKREQAEALVVEALAEGQRTRKELVALVTGKRIGQRTCDEALAGLAERGRIVPDQVGREVRYELA